MTDRGKYHGQRLKAKDVLRLYAAGERDFRGALLCGCNFRNTELSDANFSKADLRGTCFVNANMQGVNFCHVRAGNQWPWFLGQLFLVINLSALSGFLQGYSGAWIGYLFSTGKVSYHLGGLSSLALIVITCLAFAKYGFTTKGLGSGTGIGIVTVAIAIAFVSLRVGIVGGAIAVSVAGAITGSLAGTFSGVFASEIGGKSFMSATCGVVVTIGIIVAGAFAEAFEFSSEIAMIATGLITLASFFLLFQSVHQIQRSDKRFVTLNIVRLSFTTLGGSSFRGANLDGAFFNNAFLKGTNFADGWEHHTVLRHIRWYQTKNLNCARLGTSNLQDPRVRNLLVTLNGTDQNLINSDLREVNLAGATLHRINFKGANLNGATLTGAKLHGANLTESQCVGTDFTGAHLTGACLEAWNIDETTIFRDIDCQYVYLKAAADARGNRERRPHNPDKVFQPGDFEKFFKEMLDTVQLLLRNGVDPQAFQAAFEQVMANNPEVTRESIQAMEKQGDDVLLTLQVPEGTDKAQVERSWDQGYQLGLEAGYTKGLLQGQTQRAEDVREVALGFSNLLSSIQITNMNNPINSSDGGFINTGSMTGNVVNLGELSGQVTVQINQLPDAAPSRDQRSLKELLIELQSAIEAETELSDIEKKEALGEVGKLAEAGTKPQENAMQRVAKRAAANLRSITEPLTEASNLVTVCKSLLPLILAVF